MIVGEVVAPVVGVNLLALGSTVIVPQAPDFGSPEVDLLPQYVYVVLRTLTGPALTTSPKFRIGANGTHDNVAPIFTVPLAVQVGIFAAIPIVGFPFTPVNLRAGPVVLEVTQAGVGPTACAGDVVLVGMQVGL